MKYYESILDGVGNTPLLKLSRYAPGLNIFGKCEFFNPISIKDRVALNIIEKSEELGVLKKGSTLVEATSGNTGSAIALVAAMKGYKVRLYMSEDKSIERRKLMAAFGAELVLSPAAEGTKGARDMLLKDLENNEDYFYVCQHFNELNPDAHYKTTGPEIWKDTDGKIDIFVAGLGTCGTTNGVGTYLKEQNPDIKIVGIEPDVAPLIKEGYYNKHMIMGIGSGMIPGNYNADIVDEIVLVSQEEAFTACKELAMKEGLLVGISSGAVAKKMKDIASRPENKGKNIVGILADTGERYLSVKDLF